MSDKHVFLTFDLLAGGQYPIEVTLPDSTVKRGKVICKDGIISTGSNRLFPGMTDIEIDDLTHIDEIEYEVSHDMTVDMICYAINEGSVKEDEFSSGLKFRLSDLPENERAALSD